MKKYIALFLTLALCLCIFAACSDNGGKLTDENDTTGVQAGNEANPIATLTMENGGVIKIELFYDKAPNTVRNFIKLANSGFYDGLIFHRVIPNFMIQGGDPNGNGTGDPGYNIVGEFSNNGFDNDISHKRGYVSMARRGSQIDPASCYNTAGSQFFICVADCPSLDGDYAAFGYVIDGMNVADDIVAAKTDANDKPLEDIVIKSIKVETNGVSYDEPETLPAN